MTSDRTDPHAPAVASPRASTPIRRLAWLIAGIVILAVMALCAIGADLYLWDFRLYYHAGLAANQGVDPYDAAALARFTPLAKVFPVSYPWIALLPYRFLALFSWPDALLLFTALKLAALGGLLLAWRRLFPAVVRDAFFPVFLLVAFNSALILDLRSGNVALFETLLVTLAFAAFAAGRLRLFALLVALAASIKLAPLFFLSLLLVRGERPDWKPLLFGLAAFALLFFAPLPFAPEALRGFLGNAVAIIDERGSICPSTLPVLRDAFRIAAISRPRPEFVFGVVAVIVAGVGLAAMRRRRGRPVEQIVAAALTFALIHPRFKDYAYLLLVGPVYHLLLTRMRGLPRWGLLLLLILPMRPAAFTGVATWSDWAHEYYPWFLVVFCWVSSVMNEPRARRV